MIPKIRINKLDITQTDLYYFTYAEMVELNGSIWQGGTVERDDAAVPVVGGGGGERGTS